MCVCVLLKSLMILEQFFNYIIYNHMYTQTTISRLLAKLAILYFYTFIVVRLKNDMISFCGTSSNQLLLLGVARYFPCIWTRASIIFFFLFFFSFRGEDNCNSIILNYMRWGRWRSIDGQVEICFCNTIIMVCG